MGPHSGAMKSRSVQTARPDDEFALHGLGRSRWLLRLRSRLWMHDPSSPGPEDETPSQVRTYVLHPTPWVEDHRRAIEVSDVAAVLDRDLAAFVGV